MTETIATIWTFKTARFTVEVTAEPEFDSDLSWDETGEVADKINSGDLVEFCAKAAVYFDGDEIASDYLGSCIYDDFDSFRDHIGTGEIAYKARAKKDLRKAKEAFKSRSKFLLGKLRAGKCDLRYYQNSMSDARKAAKEARVRYTRNMQSAGKIGSYFADMVSTVVTEAREEIARRQSNPVELRA